MADQTVIGLGLSAAAVCLVVFARQRWVALNRALRDLEIRHAEEREEHARLRRLWRARRG